MMFLKTKINKSFLEIQNKLVYYYENESHCPFLLIENYNSNRIGLHIYINNNNIRGYYENGFLTRYRSLRHNKTWFWGYFIEKENYCIFKCVIQARPLVWLLLTIVLMLSFVWLFIKGISDIGEFSIILILTLVFAYIDYREEQKLYNELLKILDASLFN